jgi:hypothetical protein
MMPWTSLRKNAEKSRRSIGNRVQKRWSGNGSPPAACWRRNLPGSHGSGTRAQTDLGYPLDLGCQRARTGKSFAEKLSAEILEAANNQGAAIKKKEETHKMAEANRAFSHFRF